MAKKSSNDKLILDLKKQVEEKKKALEKAAKFNPVTNCQISLHGKLYNLNVATPNELRFLIVTIHSMIDGNDKYFDEPLEISGFTLGEWLQDLYAKLAITTRRVEEDKLKALEKRLHNLLSADTKVSLELEDLMKEI